MAGKSSAKGSGYERELVNQAVDSGLPAERAWGSNGKSLGHSEEVDLLVAGKRVQAKRRRSIPRWIGMTDEVDAVAIREDRGQSFVLITWWEYLDLIKSWREYMDLSEQPEQPVRGSGAVAAESDTEGEP